MKSDPLNAAAGAKHGEPAAPDGPERRAISRRALRDASIITLGALAALAALYFARPVLMPVTAALLIGLTLNPVQKWAARYKIPPAASGAILILLLCGVLYLALTLVISPLASGLAKAPDLAGLVKDKLSWLDRPLSSFREIKKTMDGPTGEAPPTVAVETSLPSVAQQVFGFLTPAISEFLVFFGTLLFFLIGVERLRVELIRRFETRAARLRVIRIWNDVEENLIAYLGTVTMINAGLGTAAGLMLWVVGFPSPIAFGALAAVLNYIPYLGAATVIVTLFAVGLVALNSFWDAALPPLLFLGIATIEGQFITPSIIGHRLTLSPFLVFLAIAFWTWLWGPLGTFMATPLLIVGLVVLNQLFPEEKALPK